ncbi:MAG TPA: alkaline phosphatase family protein [Acidimicrobiales bacterium]|nr:alkaline phosphatase family protein [Acidimicrobiales bacterium]
MGSVDRRTFLKAAAGGVAATHVHNNAAFHLIKRVIPGRATRTPIKHIVIVMQENRSVDHLLGWYGKENPAFDGRQVQTFPDLRPGHVGQTRTTANWGANGRQNFHGRGFADPSHSWDGGRAERALGRVNGWLDPKTKNDEFSLSYYDAVDVPVFAQLVRQYQTYDRWHCSLLGPTEPNRYYLHSSQSGGLKDNKTPPEYAAKGHHDWALGWTWSTMWDLYDRFNVSAACYYSNLPELAYWGARHVNRLRHVSDYFAACETGTLPAVSFINPFFNTNEFGNDDHPHSDLRLGQTFLSDITEAFVNSRHYRQGALVITYDEWGGFFDHVDPPRLADDRGTPKDPGGEDDFGQLGFRIPSMIVSPWTHRAGAVDHTLFEHTSINKFIADNWNLPYLTTRMRATNSIERAFGAFRSFQPEHAFTPYSAPLTAWRKSAIDTANITINTEASDPLNFPIAGHISGLPSWPLPPIPVPHNPLPGGSKFGEKDPSGVQKLLEAGWYEKFGIRTDWKFEDSFLHSRPELLKTVQSD